MQSQVFVPVQNNFDLHLLEYKLRHNNSTLGRIREAVQKLILK